MTVFDKHKPVGGLQSMNEFNGKSCGKTDGKAGTPERITMKRLTNTVLRKVAAVAIVPATMVAGLALGQGTAMAADGDCVVGVSTISQCFPDPVLAYAVNGSRTDRTFTKWDVKYTRSLRLDSVDFNIDGVRKQVYIKNIKGIENLTNLGTLTIQSKEITDLSPLHAFKKAQDKFRATDWRLRNNPDLSSLDIENSPNIEDFTPISDLKISSNLTLKNDGISDLTSVLPTHWGGRWGLEQVKVDLSDNEIFDLSPISNMPITTLKLDSNRISDITPLGTLKQLDILSIGDNQISDLSPLNWDTNSRGLTGDGEKATEVVQSADASGAVKVSTAKNVDGTYISPTRIRPSSGSYDPQTGMVTWKNLRSIDKASFSFKTTRLAGCGTNCNMFAGTKTVKIGGVPEAESLDPSPNSILRLSDPSTPIVPPEKPQKPKQPKPNNPTPPAIKQPDLDPGTDPVSDPLIVPTTPSTPATSGGSTVTPNQNHGDSGTTPSQGHRVPGGNKKRTKRRVLIYKTEQNQARTEQNKTEQSQSSQHVAQPAEAVVAQPKVMAQTGAAVTAVVLVAFTSLVVGLYLILAKKRREKQ